MIKLDELKEEDVGRHVIYIDSTGEKTFGRIKYWNHKWIFVVYKCDNNWNNYQNYTAASTDPNNLVWE